MVLLLYSYSYSCYALLCAALLLGRSSMAVLSMHGRMRLL